MGYCLLKSLKYVFIYEDGVSTLKAMFSCFDAYLPVLANENVAPSCQSLFG